MYSKIYIFALGILVLTSSKMGVRDTNAEITLFERAGKLHSRFLLSAGTTLMIYACLK